MGKDSLYLAWQFFQQEKHQKHHRFLRWSQGLLMVFIVTLSQTSLSIQTYLSNNLANLLGADLVISQQQHLDSTQLKQLAKMSQEVVHTKQLATTLTHNGQWQQVSLKAVGSDYPLQGELKITSALNASDEVASSGPEPGEVWLDSRLLSGLTVAVGEYLTLADYRLKVSRILLHEPDRLMEGHSVAMRAMINIEDLEQFAFPSDLIQHRYLVAADSQQITDILHWQQDNLPAAIVHHKKGEHPLALFWQRTENFMGLASIILFFMAAIAIEQLTHVHKRKEQYFSAICLSVGVSKKTGLQISIFKWLLHLLFLMPFVLVLAALCHWLVIDWLSQTFQGLQWQWHMLQAVSSIVATTAMFLVFYAPVWVSLKQSSVAQLVSQSGHKSSHWLSIGSAILVLTIVAATYSDNLLLTAMMLASMAISVMLLLVISWLVLTFGEKLTLNFSGLTPFTLFMMKQRLVSKSTQILGVGLCAFLLLFTLMLLKDLGSTMANYQRQHDGNLLVSQATEQQMTDIETWAQQHGIEVRQNKPFMYAKLTEINGQRLSDYSETPSDSLATFGQHIRLHWTDAVPANNRVIDGQWWSSDSHHWQQVSVEQEVMTDLGLALGDQLTFYIGKQSIDFVIAASHGYKPGAGAITFWVQMPTTGQVQIKAPQYHMASLELSTTQFSLLGALWQQHPSLRMVSLKEMTENFDNALAMVTKVISGFALLIITLAGIVIVSSVHGLETRERKKNSIIMSFGFSSGTCLKLNIIEWLVTGAIAASGAIIATWVAGTLIYQSQFSLTYTPDFAWLLATMTIILAVVTTIGIYASKTSLSGSIRDLMAES
ncbi:MAG: ABC transporter permease [Aestuariibacter sp.]